MEESTRELRVERVRVDRMNFSGKYIDVNNYETSSTNGSAPVYDVSQGLFVFVLFFVVSTSVCL